MYLWFTCQLQQQRRHVELAEVADQHGWGASPRVRRQGCTDKGAPTSKTALSDQAEPFPYILHGAYYVKDRDSRP